MKRDPLAVKCWNCNAATRALSLCPSCYEFQPLTLALVEPEDEPPEPPDPSTSRPHCL